MVLHPSYERTYIASAGADNIIATGKAILHGIIIGADVASATIEVSDHPSDGDANVQILLTGSTLMTSAGGYIPVHALFKDGITADLTAQTNVTFIWEPIA